VRYSGRYIGSSRVRQAEFDPGGKRDCQAAKQAETNAGWQRNMQAGSEISKQVAGG
jgi:hypothetical protein